jgi:hypothetical protein
MSTSRVRRPPVPAASRSSLGVKGASGVLASRGIRKAFPRPTASHHLVLRTEAHRGSTQSEFGSPSTVKASSRRQFGHKGCVQSLSLCQGRCALMIDWLHPLQSFNATAIRSSLRLPSCASARFRQHRGTAARPDRPNPPSLNGLAVVGRVF